MTKKEKFIKEVNDALFSKIDLNEVDPDVIDFWNALQTSGDKDKTKFTLNGKLVLNYMRDNKESYNNLFKAKDIGEGLGISSRTASGAMRKLVNDSYVEKVGENPTIYSLTQEGINVEIED